MTTKVLQSLRALRAKIYGNELDKKEITQIVDDIAAKRYNDIHISSFITACAGGRLNENEIAYLTEAMVASGNKLHWNEEIIVDKHCIGGLPGNRTTPIIVSIVAAFGLMMPKTSSRAVTSPAGTADVIEVLTNVDFSADKIKKIVEKERACLAWGGASLLSPVDDILIKVARVLDIDGEGQMVASILSKKIAAGSNHILIDIPIGPTAKVRDFHIAESLKHYLENIGRKFGIKVNVIFTDGLQPIGSGIGPALEARDFIAVLKNEENAPQDLREKSILLAGEILEFSPKVKKCEGKIIAEEILQSGKAWQKFQSICEAQGGMREIPQAKFKQEYFSDKNSIVQRIDNRHIAFIAKLAGAPQHKAAGVDLHVKIGDHVKKHQPLFTIHYETKEALKAVQDFINEGEEIIGIL